MLDPIYITALMFASMLILLFLGAPLGLSLLIVATVCGTVLWGPASLLILVTTTFGAMNNFLLIALPLFILLGLILQRSGITEELFRVIYQLMGRIPGGLGVGCVIICAIIASMVGVSGAATVSLGTIALPSMLSRGYDKQLTSGIIMAGGALGFIIPPSILLILYAFLAQASVGQLFAAGLIPGLMLATIYIVYFVIRCAINPDLGPPISKAESVDTADKIKSLKTLILPSLLIVTIVGSIIIGAATPTESAAVGVFGSIFLAAIYRKLTIDVIQESLVETARLMGMIFFIAIAAVFFSKVYTGLGASTLVSESLAHLNIDGMKAIIFMLAILITLGMFLDDFAITFIAVPIFAPIAVNMGYDTTWFAILFILTMQTAYLTPPFGFNLFYMSSVVPQNVTMLDLYKGALPFILLQILGIIIILMFPQVALWLPTLLYQ